MDSREFLALAGRMAAQGTGGEAVVRTIASRAYYAAFHVTVGLLTELKVKVRANANAHGQVRTILLGSRHADAQEMASILGDLHTHRVRADYRLSLQSFESFTLARRLVEHAERLRLIVDMSRSEDQRAELKAAFDRYLSKFN
jgi:hypothetical protein